MSNFWVYKKELEKVIIEMNKVLNILEQIQTINQEITNGERLYKLLIKSGFNENTYSQLKKDKSLLINLLVKLRYIYHEKESMCFGSNNLNLFCYKNFLFKEYKVF